MKGIPSAAEHSPHGRNRRIATLRRPLTRRAFLQAALATGLLAACRAATPTPTPPATFAAAPPLATSTLAPSPLPTRTLAPTATGTPSSVPTHTLAPSPLPSATSAPTVAPTPMPPAQSRVAIGRAASYDPTLLRQQMRALLDGIGGLGDLVKAGDRVAIKVNLTGGTQFSAPKGLTATESYMTHPEVVRVLGELLRDAGARELYIVEAVFDAESYHLFGYEEAARALEATLIDLNRSAPYPDFVQRPVGEGWFIYETFTLNRILEEVDAFVSVAKLKTHCRCGITGSLKNLVGLVPTEHYRLDPSHWWRSALHGPDAETHTRLPRVVVDLNRARPIDLALIDGIRTGQGGEVPRGSFAPLQPGVLIAGKDPVASDAVATAVMGFDPLAAYPAEPFLNGENHLTLAQGLRLGTNRLQEIEVIGAGIAEVRTRFAPCWSESG